MVNYLIICRSLTYAQRTAQVLDRAGIPGHIMRAPRSISGDGCSHGVRIGERWLTRALEVLNRDGLPPRAVYVQGAEGKYSEAAV